MSSRHHGSTAEHQRLATGRCTVCHRVGQVSTLRRSSPCHRAPLKRVYRDNYYAARRFYGMWTLSGDIFGPDTSLASIADKPPPWGSRKNEAPVSGETGASLSQTTRPKEVQNHYGTATS